MKTFLYALMAWFAQMHERIMSLNDSYELYFTDKQLHFLVIGLLGMALIFVLHPLFTWLAKNDHVLVISWLYVFTVIIVITFAIEIGQRFSGEGTMEFADIAAGIVGFMLMFAIFAVIRWIILGLIHAFRRE